MNEQERITALIKDLVETGGVKDKSSIFLDDYRFYIRVKNDKIYFFQFSSNWAYTYDLSNEKVVPWQRNKKMKKARREDIY